jgi:hypothetical protein
MAQAGYTPIQLYYSNTSGNAPAALANGEIALNQADGKLYYKTSTGVIRVLAASEVEVQVYNNTGSTIPQGSAVYLSGGATGQTPHISLAIATSAAAANVLGLTTAAISTGTAGYVTTIGLSATFNTSSFTNGDALYLSSSVAGALTATAPTSPNYAVRVGFVSYANASGRTFITMTNQYVQVSSIIGTVAPTQGGTGLTTYATGDILYASSSNVLSKLPAGSNTQILTLVSGVPAWAAPAVSGVTSFQTSLSGLTPSTSTTGAVTLAGTLGAASGGTGITSYTTGDIIYASGTTTLTALGAGTSSYVLTSNGAGAAPSWQAAPAASGVTSISFGSTGLTPATSTSGAVTVAGTLGTANGGTGSTSTTFVNLTTNVTGTLPITNGGSGQTTAAAAITALTGTQTAGQYLRSDGTNAALSAIQAADVPTLNQNTTGTAANVTGVVANTNGGTGQSSAFTQYGVTYASTTTALATTSAGTTTTVLHGNASGAPTFGAVSLTADVSGVLPVANGGTNSSTGNLSSCTADGTDAVGFRNIPQNSQSANYTLVLADSGKHIYHPSTDANARTFTIPANGSVAYPLGTAITFINQTSQVVSIAITTDTMNLSPAGTTGTRSLAQYGVATAVKVTSTSWIISGTGLT